MINNTFQSWFTWLSYISTRILWWIVIGIWDLFFFFKEKVEWNFILFVPHLTCLFMFFSIWSEINTNVSPESRIGHVGTMLKTYLPMWASSKDLGELVIPTQQRLQYYIMTFWKWIFIFIFLIWTWRIWILDVIMHCVTIIRLYVLQSRGSGIGI